MVNKGNKKDAAIIGLISATLGLEHIEVALPKGLLDSKAEKFNATVDEISPKDRRELLTEVLKEKLTNF
ncbi:hypothetical protein [Bacillus cereus]|uniref:hypothetical protein n=1 Tax=Bacillus cereus TaxID=1396 RepID=UPI000BF8C93B|nr:hypothetical protein [Bacillus cereus]PEZ37466.1 hypothetical protein CN361_10940 [Bacillus cereus]